MKMVEHHQDAARMSLNFVDRAVGFFNPKAGLDRLKNRMMLDAATGQGGYNGGRRDRRATKNWRPRPASANDDTLPDLPDLVARSRELVRNVPIATGAVATTVTNVVGDGLQLQPAVDYQALGITKEEALAWGKAAKREWWNFCKSADITGVQGFDELQGLIFRAVLESGDVLIVRRYKKYPGDVYGTKLQVVEADRLSNPNHGADTERVAGGVETDENGRPIAYHIADKHPGSRFRAKLDWQRVSARTDAGTPTVLHLFDRLRPQLTRGVPYLAPVVEHLRQLGEYTDAEVRAAVVTSFVTWFIKQQAPEDGDDPAKTVLGERDSSLPANEIKLGSGAAVELLPGEDVVAPSPTRPNPQFDAFTQAFLRQVGVALELPFELLVKHFTASYSASRAALEMAWQFFRKRRSWLAQRLCQEVYEWMIDEAVAERRLPAPPNFFDDPLVRQAYCGANWIGPNRISVDPKKEAEADEIDLRNKLKSRAQIKYERVGGEIEDTIAELGEEQRLIEREGLQETPAAAPASSAGDANGSDDDTETQPQRGRA